MVVRDITAGSSFVRDFTVPISSTLSESFAALPLGVFAPDPLSSDRAER